MKTEATLKRVIYVLGAAALLFGLWGFYLRFFVGERMVNYGSYVVWGLWVAMYLFYGGISTGSMMIASLDYLFGIRLFKGIGKTALWAAVVTMPAALVTIGMDLGHMERVWKVFLQPNLLSVMAQLVWGYSIFMVVLLAALWLIIRLERGKQDARPGLRFVMAVGLFLSIFLSGGVGALLGVNASREAWHTAMLPAQFPVFSLLSGCALMLVLLGWFAPADEKRNSQLRALSIGLLILLLIKTYYLWVDYSQALYAGTPVATEAVEQVLFGRWGWAFWLLQLGLGMVFPIAFLLYKRFQQNPLWSGVVGVAVLVGIAVARANIIFPMLSIPELEGLATAFTGPHLTFDYYPSLMEWSVTLGVTGGAALAWLLGMDYLPFLKTQSKEVAQ